MSHKGICTTATFLEWDTFQNLIRKLERDGEYKFCVLIATGVYTGLRISDLLSLKKSDVLDKTILEINEGKTGKPRKIKINDDLKNILDRVVPKYINDDQDQSLFMNRFGNKPIDKSYVNVKLKDISKKYKLKVNGFTTHSFRKTLGRRVVEVNNYSNESLLLLTELFNHSNMAITKRYLGIRQDEIFDVYDSLSL
jgi:integrase